MALRHLKGALLTFAAYIAEVERHARYSPYLRRGQAYFNVLSEVDPELARSVAADGRLDPFYDDSKLPAFLNFVGTAGNWS